MCIAVIWLYINTTELNWIEVSVLWMICVYSFVYIKREETQKFYFLIVFLIKFAGVLF